LTAAVILQPDNRIIALVLRRDGGSGSTDPKPISYRSHILQLLAIVVQSGRPTAKSQKT
jgi:hypothetical protein